MYWAQYLSIGVCQAFLAPACNPRPASSGRRTLSTGAVRGHLLEWVRALPCCLRMDPTDQTLDFSIHEHEEKKRMSSREIVLCQPVRTAIGAFNGALKSVAATDLGATVVRETLKRTQLDAAHVGGVVMGNVIQAGNKMNPARQAAIGGGLPVTIPALTINRVCGSGAQAIVTAAQQIATG